MKNPVSTLSRVLLIITSVLLVISIFLPTWRIELDAPQYPEGLFMQIYPNKLAGNIDIINGLNHYIGMATLHTENFIEFTVLPYILGVFSLLILLAAIIGGRKWLFASFIGFLLFGIIAMADFWRWEYNYGHNLDPHAAIVVPGMSYQPPLIGFKQLLNFGAFSVPDIGGWVMVAGGLLMLIAVLKETNVLSKLLKRNAVHAVLVMASLTLFSCTVYEPTPIKLNSDHCHYCGMTISDGRFGCELISKKGKAYVFDDLRCMLSYKKENMKTEVEKTYIHDFEVKGSLIDATTAFFVNDENLKSPMGGNTAAFKTKEAAQKFSEKSKTSVYTWAEITK